MWKKLPAYMASIFPSISSNVPPGSKTSAAKQCAFNARSQLSTSLDGARSDHRKGTQVERLTFPLALALLKGVQDFEKLNSQSLKSLLLITVVVPAP